MSFLPPPAAGGHRRPTLRGPPPWRLAAAGLALSWLLASASAAELGDEPPESASFASLARADGEAPEVGTEWMGQFDEPVASDPEHALIEDTDKSSMRSIVHGMQTEVVWRAWTHDWMATTMVPEPQTYALWLAGLVVIGFVALRRRAP